MPSRRSHRPRPNQWSLETAHLHFGAQQISCGLLELAALCPLYQIDYVDIQTAKAIGHCQFDQFALSTGNTQNRCVQILIHLVDLPLNRHRLPAPA